MLSLEHLQPCGATINIEELAVVVLLVRGKAAPYQCVMGVMSLKSLVNFVHSLRFFALVL